jgi:hypothetical protein
MSTGGCGRRGRLAAAAVLLVVAVMVMMTVGGCGGDDSAAVSSTVAASPGTSGQPSGGGEGVLVAQEILAAFDELVGEVAALSTDKPDPDVLKPQLEELYTSYEPRMSELNVKYLALRDSDIAQFGECNTYLGANRGKHVADKDNVLSEALRYYNFELGDQETVSLISSRPVELLEIAVRQN